MRKNKTMLDQPGHRDEEKVWLGHTKGVSEVGNDPHGEILLMAIQTMLFHVFRANIHTLNILGTCIELICLCLFEQKTAKIS